MSFVEQENGNKSIQLVHLINTLSTTPEGGGRRKERKSFIL